MAARNGQEHLALVGLARWRLSVLPGNQPVVSKVPGVAGC